MLDKYILSKGDKKTPFENREKIGYITATVSLAANIFLTVFKLVIGVFTHSISVLADAFNNLIDATSSIILIVGMKLAHRPSDKEHPFGHGRIEYIATLIVSCLIIVVGIQFSLVSIKRIKNPTVLAFSLPSLIILIVTIAVKFYLSIVNGRIAKAINSSTIKATATDYMGDVLVTTVVLIPVIFSRYMSFPLDGVIGFCISLFIVYSGISLIREAMTNIIGEMPSEKFINKIKEDVLKHEEVIGLHGTSIHAYGPETTIVIVHIEFPYDMSFVEVHEITDRMEREISKKYKIKLIIHQEPVGLLKSCEKEIIKEVDRLIDSTNALIEYHDFTIRDENTVIFDVICDGKIIKNDKDEENLRQMITNTLQEKFPQYQYDFLIEKIYL